MAREVTLWSIPGFIVIKEPHDSIVALTPDAFLDEKGIGRKLRSKAIRNKEAKA